MFRQGDLLIQKVSEMPKGKKLKTNLLALGEATGHHHKLETLRPNGSYMVVDREPLPEGQTVTLIDGEQSNVKFVSKRISGLELAARFGMEIEQNSKKEPELVEKDGDIFFKLENTTVLTHQEHGAIVLSPGTYRNVIQQEYVPKAVPRRVAD